MAATSENQGQAGETKRVEGENYQERQVPLLSHDHWTRLAVRCAKDGNHACIEFNAYWKGASVNMELTELAQFRDAINAVLMEAEHER
jgi:hypothetical protein